MDLSSLARVVLDTSACIYYLERPPGDPRREVLVPLMRTAETGAVNLVVSPVTACELLVAPLRRGDRLAEGAARLFLTGLCRLSVTGLAVAGTAARLRAVHNLPTPDALVCAAGVVEGADAVVGNDARWRRVADIAYVHLDDLVAGRGVEGTPGGR